MAIPAAERLAVQGMVYNAIAVKDSNQFLQDGLGLSSQIETVSDSIRFQGDSGDTKILITVTTKDFLNDRSLAE